jgi:hypothetical protein
MLKILIDQRTQNKNPPINLEYTNRCLIAVVISLALEKRPSIKIWFELHHISAFNKHGTRALDSHENIFIPEEHIH